MTAWLLTNTTYGTWLPGDPRGSITSVRNRRSDDPRTRSRIEHDKPGQPCEPAIPQLRRSAQSLLKGPPILFGNRHASVLARQFRETAAYRDWSLLALAVMPNHIHLVVVVQSNRDPRRILIDFKAYGSRALNREFGKPSAGTWWTTNGSKRLLQDERAVHEAANYVLHKQLNPLLTWASGRLDGEP